MQYACWSLLLGHLSRRSTRSVIFNNVTNRENDLLVCKLLTTAIRVMESESECECECESESESVSVSVRECERV